MVRDSHFSSMASHSAIYLLDIDYNATSAKQRGVSYFEDNRLRDCDGPSSLIEIALIDNNDNVEDDYRVIVDANTFSDNVAVDDLIALRSLDAGTGGAPSLYLVNNSFADNVVDSLLHCDEVFAVDLVSNDEVFVLLWSDLWTIATVNVFAYVYGRRTLSVSNAM